MLKKLCDLFAGVKFTIVSGVFLALSLVLMLMKKEVAFDPAWVTVVLSGYPLLYLAISRLIKQKWISSCLLISMAMIASLSIGELFAAGEVAFIMAVGAILEDMTVGRAKKGLSELIKLTPETARIIIKTGDKTEEKTVNAAELNADDIIRVLPGEKIPADGIIISGETSVNQSVITGESLPADKNTGDFVYCGSMNLYGSADIKVTGAGENSSLSKLIKMVREAEKNKAPIQRIADKWSVWLVPVALGIAVLAFLINYLTGMEVMEALHRGVTVLVVFCPCALALATPTSVMAAIARGAKKGIVIKSGAALETMGKTDVIAFDKTGTITCGKLMLRDTVVFDGKLNEVELISLLAAAESKSEHPLAKAVISYAEENKIAFPEPVSFRMKAGGGVNAEINGTEIYCGTEKYLNENGIILSDDIKKKAENYSRQGKALIFISCDNKVSGLVTLSDIIREDSAACVKELKNIGVKTVLLTGDSENAAEYFGKTASVDKVYASLLPEDKVGIIKEIKKSGSAVAMVGDGINDAPALKTADVGIAMGGTGSDIAVEAADVVLMKDDIKNITFLKKLSKKTLSTIKFNITASMCINAVAVTLSVLGLLNPVTGALVHNLGSFLVVLNSALLYDRRI